MQHLPGPEIEPMSPALADGFFTTEPPWKPTSSNVLNSVFNICVQLYKLSTFLLSTSYASSYKLILCFHFLFFFFQKILNVLLKFLLSSLFYLISENCVVFG